MTRLSETFFRAAVCHFGSLVNGREHRLSIDPRLALLGVPRERWHGPAAGRAAIPAGAAPVSVVETFGTDGGII